MTQTGTACPCGSGRFYGQCCRQYHDGVSPESAQALMRSRYSAYALGLERYLLDTWHPATRPTSLGLSAKAQVRWLGLKVLRCTDGGPGQDRGTVEFVARCKTGGRARRLHEVSRFVREDGRWFYLDGDAGN